jgi:hypothetical protein
MSSQENRAGRGSAVDVIPAAITFTYVVLGIHGLLLLLGVDDALWGPSLSPARCFAVVGLFLVRKLVAGRSQRG